jgi:hypothetical protein
MVTELKHSSLTRLHQAHLMSLRARMLLKEKELQIQHFIHRGDYVAAVQEKEAYRYSAKLLLEGIDVLRREYTLRSEQEREDEIGSALFRIILEFEHLEQTLIF